MNFIAKVACAALSIGWVASAQAAPITGSLSFADGGNETGQSLLTRTSFTVPNATTQAGAGDFVGVPANLPVTISNFTIPSASVTAVMSPSSFTASFSGGTFLASSARKSDQSAPESTTESITVFFLGTFTPSGILPASTFQPNAASVIANLNRAGTGTAATVSSGFTLASPPVSGVPLEVPEPASLALLGIGLAGLGLVRRRAA